MEAGRSSIIMIMELVAAVVSALIISGENLAGWEWVGCGMILTATLMESIKEPMESIKEPTINSQQGSV